MRVVLTILTVSGLCLAPLGCGDDGGGGDKSCSSLCSQAQAGSCTSIKGDCGKFCSALDAAQGPANCTSQRNAYQSCLSAGVTVCGSSCGTQESALTTCVGLYCLANLSNADCQTLKASFGF